GEEEGVDGVLLGGVADHPGEGVDSGGAAAPSRPTVPDVHHPTFGPPDRHAPIQRSFQRDDRCIRFNGILFNFLRRAGGCRHYDTHQRERRSGRGIEKPPAALPTARTVLAWRSVIRGHAYLLPRDGCDPGVDRGARTRWWLGPRRTRPRSAPQHGAETLDRPRPERQPSFKAYRRRYPGELRTLASSLDGRSKGVGSVLSTEVDGWVSIPSRPCVHPPRAPRARTPRCPSSRSRRRRSARCPLARRPSRART